ncbi:aspartyl protease family protein [Chitinimonas taiwanensis DSM 18899]|uniref:Aspartyl protease family protein n=1 Tax=Chitinimonas taiwanensis DSM 18899 TaxID=1121279 RepID=A0A1K2HKS4_9NEIS|nr:aspartyl protease family protein [Chitinimonas taiwanensis DSM 18899]
MASWRAKVRKLIRGALALSLLCAQAAEPVLLATMGNKASVSFGDKPVTLSVGQSREGVKLVSVAPDSAVFEADGKRRQVRLGQGFFAPGGGEGQASGSANSATLFSVGHGHFMANISSGQGTVRGIIDTGASFLSLSTPQAAQLGLRIDRSNPILLSTAQGRKVSWRGKANSLKIEGITLYEVDVVVSEGNFPEVPLIGMSVLNRLQMQRDGDTMTLKKKF